MQWGMWAVECSKCFDCGYRRGERRPWWRHGDGLIEQARGSLKPGSGITTSGHDAVVAKRPRARSVRSGPERSVDWTAEHGADATLLPGGCARYAQRSRAAGRDRPAVPHVVDKARFTLR